MQYLLHPTPSPSKCWAPRSGPRAGEHPHLHRTPWHGQYPTFRDTATLTVPHLHGHPNPSSTPPSRTPQHCQYSTFRDTPTLPAPHLHRHPSTASTPASTGCPNTASTPPPQDTPTLPVPHLQGHPGTASPRTADSPGVTRTLTGLTYLHLPREDRPPGCVSSLRRPDGHNAIEIPGLNE